MAELSIRKLKASEIEVRVSQINQKGCTLLLYKDARVDQKILDETFGIYGWKRTHQIIGDRLYCTISVWDMENQQWVEKQDVGTESNTEKEKGQASDAFKRAGFNVGIGRELYTAPFIWISNDLVDIKSNPRNPSKFMTYDKFKVLEIDYENDKISKLVIVKVGKNSASKVYEYNKGGKK